MKRSKIVKLSVLVLVVGFVFMGFVIGVTAANRRKTVKYRPLSHYVKNNPSVFYWWVGPFPTYDYVLDMYGDGSSPPLGTYGGSIEERELPDGRAEITVYLSAHDVPFWIVGLMDGTLVMEGLIEWYFEVEKFIIERPGAEIPCILDIPYPDDFLIITGCGEGHGIFTESASDFGFTPGGEGMFYLFEYADEFGNWPYEILDVCEL